MKPPFSVTLLGLVHFCINKLRFQYCIVCHCAQIYHKYKGSSKDIYTQLIKLHQEPASVADTHSEVKVFGVEDLRSQSVSEGFVLYAMDKYKLD